MNKTVITILSTYIYISFRWFYIHLFLLPNEQMIERFSVLCGVSVAVLGVFVLNRLKKVRLYIKRGLVLILVSSLVLSSVLFVGYQDMVLNLLSVSALLIALYGVLQLSEEEMTILSIFPKFFSMVLMIVLLVVIFSGAILSGFFDFELFLIFFVPLLYVALISSLSILTLGKYEDDGSIRWFLIIGLSFTIQFIHTLLYLYSHVTADVITAGASQYLHTTGMFMLFVGLLGISNSYSGLFLGRHSGVTYFRDVTYRVPTSLN